jgi:hypothetical protein
MSVEKSELRAAAVHDLGARIDDGLEKAVAQKNQAIGAVLAHEKGAQDITVLKLKVQQSIDAGELDFDQAKLVLSWLDQAVTACQNLHKQASGVALKAEGVEMGLKAAIEITSAAHGQELAKGKAHEDKGGEKTERRVPVKARRQAEAKKKKAVTKKKTAAKKKTTKKG